MKLNHKSAQQYAAELVTQFEKDQTDLWRSLRINQNYHGHYNDQPGEHVQLAFAYLHHCAVLAGEIAPDAELQLKKDMREYGEAFMLDGKRIDPERITHVTEQTNKTKLEIEINVKQN